MTLPRRHAAVASPVVLAIFAAAAALLVASGVWAFLATRPAKPYPAGSPDEMLDSMHAMVLAGRAERLVELVEVAPPSDVLTDRDQMRQLYAAVAALLGHLQGLGDAIAEAYPEELEAFRAELANAEASGKSPSLITSLMGSAGGGRRDRQRSFSMSFEATPEQHKRATRAITALLADPYRALADNRTRITTQKLDDESAALLLDGRPIMPPMGLIARRQRDGLWKLVPPTTLPMVNQFMPRTDDEYKIWGSLIVTLDNVITDLENEVQTGQLTTLDALADSAFQKIVIPAGMVMVAYGKALEERKKLEP